MQAKFRNGKTQDELDRQHVIAPSSGQFRNSQVHPAHHVQPGAAPRTRPASAGSAPQLDLGVGVLTLEGAVPARSSGLALPENKTITISVIAGPSKGLTHRLSKPLVSIGRTGGGADIEIDEPAASYLHCAVGVKGDMVRLCDLDSSNGTYVNNERACSVALDHLSEFKVGSSLLLVTILPKRESSTV